MLPVTNISTYKFTELADLSPLRESLIDLCKTNQLKGTILLSTEGINLFVAGAREGIDILLSKLKKIPGLEDLTPKISESAHQPFTRMLVKIKKEIIAFGVESVKPGTRTSPKLPPQELKRWLDEKKELILLDTRNDYEVKLGTFKNAIPAGIDTFKDFPAAVEKLPADYKNRPVVMFCTGGIRCEKAGPYMEQQGFKNIFQLDGGILKYFEECGEAHYEGGCFVFDQRVGVDPSLLETQDKQCFLCLSPLTVEDQKDSRYVLGKSCPYCFKSPLEKMQASIEKRHMAIKKVTSPLPGSHPYDQFRPLKIPKDFEGFTFLDFVSSVFPHLKKSHWEKEFEEGRFLNSENRVVSPTHKIKAGERYLHLSPQKNEPEVNADIKILYEDEALIVVDKPAPLPTHPSGRFNRNSLQWILSEVYAPSIPRPVHRLDANTSGVMVLARSKHFAGLLQPQFLRGEVEKTYVAQIHGHPLEDKFICEAPILNETIELGARVTGPDGQPARTEFKVLKRHTDGTSDVEALPKTGRTNQIRVHLWSLGFPIVGDPVYLPFHKMGEKQTLNPEDPPLQLISKKLRFVHPNFKKPMEFFSSRNLSKSTPNKG